MRRFLLISRVAALSLLALAPVEAQKPVATTADSARPWAAFEGCWAPSDGPQSLAVTCFVPVEGRPLEVEQLSVVAGSIVRSITLRADNERRDIDAEGCEGWESAVFSVDGARVYTRGSATCAEGTEQATSGLFSITPEGEFLQVAAIVVGEQRTLTTQRSARLAWFELPPVLQSRLAPTAKLADGARTRAARPLNIDVIEDALQFSDPFVVEAWMAETGTARADFRVTRRELARLVAMKAPTRIIDMSVALANPQQFAPRVEPTQVANVWGSPRQRAWLGSGMSLDAFCDQFQLGMMSWRGDFPIWSPVGFMGMGMSSLAWFPQCAGRGFYSQWAFGNYGYGNWYGVPFNGVPGTVVVSPPPRSTPGTVTKGNGYTRGSGSTSSGGLGQTRNNSGPSTVRATSSISTSSSGGSSSSSGGTRSAGSNGTGRTAQPRNP